MKRDFSTILDGISGQKLIDGEGNPLTLGVVSVNALMSTYPDEPNLNGMVKFQRWQVGCRIADGGIDGAVIEVSAEEVTMIKHLIGRSYPPMVVGPAYLALEKDPEQTGTTAV